MYSAEDLLNVLAEKATKGNREIIIERLNLCNRKTQYDSILSYATKPGYEDAIINNNSIKAIIVPIGVNCYDEIMMDRNGLVIYSEFPERDFYTIHEHLCKNGDFYEEYNFESIVGQNCKIHNSAVIDPGVKIGNNVSIGANSSILKGTIIEDNVIIGNNTVIGASGFQIITVDNYRWNITHVGRTHICQNSYIGNCTVISSSLFEGETYIGKGAMIDNLVNVSHNCYVGDGAVLTVNSILSGSVVVNSNAWLSPNTTVMNRVEIGVGAMSSIGSIITQDIPEHMMGYGITKLITKYKEIDE